MSFDHTPKSVGEFLVFIAEAAKAAPEIARFVQSLIGGDETARQSVLAIMGNGHNPMLDARPSRHAMIPARPVEIVEWPSEYADDKPESD